MGVIGLIVIPDDRSVPRQVVPLGQVEAFGEYSTFGIPYSQAKSCLVACGHGAKELDLVFVQPHYGPFSRDVLVWGTGIK